MPNKASVIVSTQENTRSTLETQLDISDWKRSLTQKLNLFFAGSISTQFSEWGKTYKYAGVLSTVPGMLLHICNEEFPFKNKPKEIKFSSKEEYFKIKERETSRERSNKGVYTWRRRIYDSFFLFQRLLILLGWLWI